MDSFKFTDLTKPQKQTIKTRHPTFAPIPHQGARPPLKVRIQEDEDSECSSRSEDSSGSFSQYHQKLENYRKMSEVHKRQKEEAEDEQPNIMKPKIIEPILKNNQSTVNQHRAQRSISKSTVIKQKPSRPTTSHSHKPVPKPMKKIRTRDPVSLYQEFNLTWKKDAFLSKGANKKQGRKLMLSQRNRRIGLLY